MGGTPAPALLETGYDGALTQEHVSRHVGLSRATGRALSLTCE